MSFFLIFIIFLLFLAILILAIVFIFIYISTIYSYLKGAPFYPLEKEYIDEILGLVNFKKDDIFVDFGCGDGRVLIEAVKKFDLKRAYGIEAAPYPYFLALFKIKKEKLKNRIEIKNCDFFKISQDFLSQIDVLYIYLFPELVSKIEDKIFPYLKKGAKIIAVSFFLKEGNKDFKIINASKVGWHKVLVYEKIS